MILKILIKGDTRYRLIKIYNDFVLYENEKTGARECFTKFQLGLVKEVVKLTPGARKYGACKH